MRRCLLLLALTLLCAATPAAAAPATVRPERLMVLVIGPSSNPVNPDEADAVQRLNQLRRQNGLEAMQLGTMHFDQPEQAKFAKERLGIQRKDLVAVALVELDDRKSPKRSLYTIPRVTGDKLDSLQGTVTRWAQMAGVPLRPRTDLDEPPLRDEQMTQEGILNTARRLETLTSRLWDSVKNEPLRRDQADRPVRRALLGLAENARLLRAALEQGRVNPREQFELVVDSGQEWRDSRPELSLPVPYRGQVPSIDEALAGIRQAYRQLNR